MKFESGFRAPEWPSEAVFFLSLGMSEPLPAERASIPLSTVLRLRIDAR